MSQYSRKAIGWCESCRKLLYLSRRLARQGAKTHGAHKSTYQCPANDQFWHVGGLPIEIRHGHVSREEFYRDREVS